MNVPNDTTRSEILADYRALLDFLDAHPDVPVRRNDLNSYPLGGNDATGLPELHRIAAALGVEVTHNAQRSHFYAIRTFGRVSYQAAYVTDAYMAEYDEDIRYARERREQLRDESEGGVE